MSQNKEDRVAVDRIRAKVESGDEELIPSEVVDRLLAGESPIRVWREYRGLTMAKLAELSGVDPSYVSAIEAGRVDGRADALASLAEALKVEVGDLVPRDGV